MDRAGVGLGARASIRVRARGRARATYLEDTDLRVALLKEECVTVDQLHQ